MIDIQVQIVYWRNGAKEDWVVAQELLENGRIRHGLFFVHLALEKALKAHVCQKTHDLAPRIHNLVRLAELAGVSLSQEQIDVLADINTFNIEGRYPELLAPLPTLSEVKTYVVQAKEVLEWLTNLWLR